MLGRALYSFRPRLQVPRSDKERPYRSSRKTAQFSLLSNCIAFRRTLLHDSARSPLRGLETWSLAYHPLLPAALRRRTPDHEQQSSARLLLWVGRSITRSHLRSYRFLATHADARKWMQLVHAGRKRRKGGRRERGYLRTDPTRPAPPGTRVRPACHLSRRRYVPAAVQGRLPAWAAHSMGRHPDPERWCSGEVHVFCDRLI